VVDGQTQVTVVGEGNSTLSLFTTSIAGDIFQGEIEKDVRYSLWGFAKQ
jgi:hypothetical protein